MKRLIPALLLVVSLGCNHQALAPTSTTTSPGSTAPVTFAIHLNGAVYGDDGAAVAGAAVSVQPYFGQPAPSPVVTVTDGTGHYDVSFAGNTAAILSVTHDGFERTVQSAQIRLNAPTITTNVTLYRIVRVAAGESDLVSIPMSNVCGIDDEFLCRTVRVSVPGSTDTATLQLQVTADRGLQVGVGSASVANPTVPKYPCCGSQLQLSVRGGDEAVVVVTLPWTSQPGTVTLQTSLK